MQGMNKVFLMGFLGSDPKKMVSKNGNPYTRFNLATHRNWRKEDGQEERRTDWHTVFVWGKRGDNCAEYLRKGSPVLIEGSLSTFDITNDEGETVHKIAITASEVEFLSSKKLKPEAKVELEGGESQQIPF